MQEKFTLVNKFYILYKSGNYEKAEETSQYFCLHIKKLHYMLVIYLQEDFIILLLETWKKQRKKLI
ncbi:hypothetical protein DRQ09_04380 [candidate division KSB1 bacterium]|nr:MAG: hypothetical protein DRQ09_04380 [candidate division KSB1 bacterium]